MYAVAALKARVEVPWASIARAPPDPCPCPKRVMRALHKQLESMLTGEFSPRHGCYVLAVLRVVEVDEIGVLQTPWATRRMQQGGLPYAMAPVPGCVFECVFAAAVCCAWQGQILDAVVTQVLEHTLHLLAGPVTVIVHRPDDADCYQHRHVAEDEQAQQPAAWVPEGARAASRWVPPHANFSALPHVAMRARGGLACGSVVRVRVDEVVTMHSGQTCYATLLASNAVHDEPRDLIPMT